MISTEHVELQQINSEQEINSNEVSGPSSMDNNVIVSTEDSNIDNQQESLQNQVALTSPNTIVNQSIESFGSWSTSTESNERQGQLVEHNASNAVNQIDELIGNRRAIVNTFSGNTNLHPVFADKRIFKGPVNIHQNVYCCPSTLFENCKPFSSKCCPASYMAMFIGIMVVIFLCIWFSTLNITKPIPAPVTTVVSTMVNPEGNLYTTTDLANTVSSNQIIHSHTEASSTESTDTSNDDYSYNTEEPERGKVYSSQSPFPKTQLLSSENTFKVITRTEWDAAPSLKKLSKLKVLPAPRVIISETSTESCKKTDECMKIVRRIQRSYITPPMYPDIAYNFLVGADGFVYEGRGWDVKGDVAPSFDFESINIAFIGNFSLVVPPEKQIRAALKLIRFGVDNGNINMFFKLNGKRQVVYYNFNNPGDKLYDIITKWQQWEPGTIFSLQHKSNEYNETISQ